MRNGVEKKVSEIVAQMYLHPSYVFQDWTNGNIDMDNVELPCVMYVLPVSGVFNISDYHIKDCPDARIFFLDKARLDASGKEQDNVVENCKSMAKEFILLVNASGYFKPVDGEIPVQMVYDEMDAGVTGVAINIRLEETAGTFVCPKRDIPRVIYNSQVLRDKAFNTDIDYE